MKPPLKLGWPDYVLIALTCGLVLLVIEYWSPPARKLIGSFAKGQTGGGRAVE